MSRTYVIILLAYITALFLSILSAFRDENAIEESSNLGKYLYSRGHGEKGIDMLLSKECKAPKKMSSASKGRRIYFSRALGIAYVPIFKCNHVNIKTMMSGTVLDELGIKYTQPAEGTVEWEEAGGCEVQALKNYTVFTFTRDPTTRAMAVFGTMYGQRTTLKSWDQPSCNSKQGRGTCSSKEKMPLVDCAVNLEDCFTYFLKTYQSSPGTQGGDYHADPQIMYTGGGRECKPNGAVKFDFIGTLEHFAEDWISLLKFAGRLPPEDVEKFKGYMVREVENTLLKKSTELGDLNQKELDKPFKFNAKTYSTHGKFVWERKVKQFNMTSEHFGLLRRIYKYDYKCLGFAMP